MQDGAEARPCATGAAGEDFDASQLDTTRGARSPEALAVIAEAHRGAPAIATTRAALATAPGARP